MFDTAALMRTTSCTDTHVKVISYLMLVLGPQNDMLSLLL